MIPFRDGPPYVLYRVRGGKGVGYRTRCGLNGRWLEFLGVLSRLVVVGMGAAAVGYMFLGKEGDAPSRPV